MPKIPFLVSNLFEFLEKHLWAFWIVILSLFIWKRQPGLMCCVNHCALLWHLKKNSASFPRPAGSVNIHLQQTACYSKTSTDFKAGTISSLALSLRAKFASKCFEGEFYPSSMKGTFKLLGIGQACRFQGEMQPLVWECISVRDWKMEVLQVSNGVAKLRVGKTSWSERQVSYMELYISPENAVLWQLGDRKATSSI